MEIDDWIDGYKVRAFPWIDGKNIYFSVSCYTPGQALSQGPAWEKVAYITYDETARRAMREWLHTLVRAIAGLKIPEGGHAEVTLEAGSWGA